MVTKRRFWITAAAAVLIILVMIIGAWIKFLYTPLITEPNGIKYTVRQGSSMRTVINELSALNILKNPRFFKILVNIKHVSNRLKAGEYFFAKGTTSPKLLHQITTGTGIVYYTFMIVPGWTFQDIRTALLKNENVHHTIQNMSDDDVMKKLGHFNVKPEGEFFPDTYFFTKGTDDSLLLKRAFTAMEKKLNKAWQNRETDLPFKTPYEALIAASIIEKEFYFKEELPKIAGVLVNRLRKNMLLQFDPTVIYGIGPSFDGKIRRSDLLSSNPFNTYVHKGLPPTPISMPSFSAIDAILHPMKHDYYYFVAQEIGSHLFSKQLQDHYQAVEQIKKMHWFFNRPLIRSYLLNMFAQRKELND